MNNWKLFNLSYLSGRSDKSDNMGQIPLTAKYQKTFVNNETGELRKVTDLESKIYKRDKNLKLFFKIYSKHFTNKKVSLLSAVVNQENYSTITKFVNTINRKLKRAGVDRLGYVWIRDVGDEIFHKHFHIIIATSRIREEIFYELFCKKKHNHYEVQFVKTIKGILKYIIDKDLFGEHKQRSYGKSRKFPIKKKQITKLQFINAN